MTLLKSLLSDSKLHLEQQLTYKSFFFVKKNNRNIKINIEDVLWVKADGASVEITHVNGSVITYANLGSFEKQIQHPDLMRVHRSYIVNLTKVDSYDDQFLYVNCSKKETKIPISRTYRKEALKSFKQLRAD